MSWPWSPDTFSKFCKKVKECGDEGALVLTIEALLAITAALLVFLGVFGSFRRRCSNRALASVGFTAYNLLPIIVTYTFGLFQGASFCTLHFPLWLVYLVIALGKADSYNAHSVEEIELWKSFSIESATTCFMASSMIASYVTQSKQMLSTVLLFVILFMKVEERVRALMFASNCMMQKNVKLVADHMGVEHECSDSRVEDPAAIDPVTILGGCKYLVRVAKETKVASLYSTAACKPKKSHWQDGKAPDYQQRLQMADEVITVEKVWNCGGRLLKESEGDPDGQLKDLCLSFSLFKFVCLRFAPYSLPKNARDHLRCLIFCMLSQKNGYERVFRIIEVELAFLFDLFYTRYAVNLNPSRLVYKLIQLTILVAVALISVYMSTVKCKELRWFDVFVTILLTTSILVVEFAQFGFMIFSEWAKVTYICKYVQSKWWQKKYAGKLIEVMCRVWILKPWGRQLRQYSLLESCSYSPCKLIHNRFTSAFFDPERNGQKQIAPTNLSKQVMEAITQFLVEHRPSNLEMGIVSLGKNDFRNLSWACDLETITHVIMVWHIATTIWEHEAPLSDSQFSQEQRDNFGIATKLSKYLAYLVAFAPRLLPDHTCRTEYIFDCAVSEARNSFKGSFVSMGERIQWLKVPDERKSPKPIENFQETILGRGARLGKELVESDKAKAVIWTFLVQFWVEMMLYVAPSDDAHAHARYLTTGGEFVTHVWVLVSHAGIARVPDRGEQHDDP